jgi:predicted GNAT family acetyltransferase
VDLGFRVEDAPHTEIDLELRARGLDEQLSGTVVEHRLAKAPQEVRQTIRVARVREAKLHRAAA